MDDLQDIFSENWAEDYRSGIVAVVGRPNAGKSTLINAILQQKIAIVTPKPQTTRQRQLGIYTDDEAQILFVDTPGIHDAFNKLGEYMAGIWEEALRDADIVLWILDVTAPLGKQDTQIGEIIKTNTGDTPVILALNKTDLKPLEQIAIEAYTDLVEHEKMFFISALQGDAIPELVRHLKENLPEGPLYYPADQISEVSLRFMVAEIIREKIILHTEKEIPYSAAVEVTSFKEGEERTTIHAVIYVERESQKGIVVGKGGQMIKKIGTQARREIKKMLETPVYLDLRVKVLKNWRSNEAFMKRVGYVMVK